MVTYLNQVLGNIEVVELLQVHSFNDALQRLLEINASAVSYTEQKEYVVNNQGVLEVRNGLYLFEMPISRSADLCSSFESNIPIEVVVGHETIAQNDILVMTNCQYNQTSVRFLLDPQNIPDRINVSYKVTLLEPNVRQQLVQTPSLVSGSLLYNNGVVRKIQIQ